MSKREKWREKEIRDELPNEIEIEILLETSTSTGLQPCRQAAGVVRDKLYG